MKNYFFKKFLVLTTSLLIIFNLVIGAQNISSNKFEYRDNQRINTRTNIVAAMYNVNSQVYQGTPEQIARQFLDENKSVFGISSISELRFIEVIESPASKHVGLIQTFNGIPVFGSEAVVSINHENRVSMVVNGNYSNIKLSYFFPTISDLISIRSVKNKLNVDEKALITQPTARLVVYQDSIEVYHLAWQVNFNSGKPYGDWQAFVDSQTGQILTIYDISMRYVNGQGKVFKPDPITSLQNISLTDNSDADYSGIQNAYKTENLLDLNDAQSGTYRIQGRYARSEEIEPDQSNGTYTKPPVTKNDSSFLYTRDQNGFEETNTYFFVDTQRRYVGSLGFTPQWGGSDAMQFDSHAEWGAHNAHYHPGGSPPYLTFGDGGIDVAEDQDVVLHEYAHALHDALMVGTGVSQTGYDDEARVSEGSGDYMALSYRRTLSSFQQNHIFNWAGNSETWYGRTLNSSYVYPTNWTGDIYDPAGVLWASTMIDIESSSGIGRDVANTLLLKSFSYVSSSSTIIDHVYAIFQADRDIYSGSHLSTLASVFYNRGFFYGNQVSGTISSNTTWSGMKSVTGDVTINSGTTLTIQSSTFVFFAADKQLVVNGTLNVQGSSSDTVRFMLNGASGNWVGIRFNNGSSGSINYAKIQKSTWGIFFNNLGNTNISVTNSRIQDNSSYGIWCANSSLMSILNNHIINNGSYGIYCDNYSSPYIYCNVIRGGHSVAGLYCNYYSSPFASTSGGAGNNIITGNSGCGLYANYNSNPHFGDGTSYAYNSIYTNTSDEVRATNGSTVWVQNNYWGSGAAFNPDQTSTIHNESPLNYDPNQGRTLIVDPGDNKTKTARVNLNVGSNSLNLKNKVVTVSDYNDELSQWLDVFKKERNTPDGRYALIKIEECYSKAKKDGFEEFVNAEIFSRKGIKDELTVMGLELINHSLMSKGDYQAVIKNLEMIKNELLLNESIEKNTLFAFGSIYLNSINDKTQASKYFEELKQKFPNDLLVYNSELLLGNHPDPKLFKEAGTDEKQSKNEVPANLELSGNYPNPFNPTTIISYTLPEDGNVQIKVFDVLGREVAELINGFSNAGKHNIVWDGANFASGIYFYSITFKDQTLYKKMLLMK